MYTLKHIPEDFIVKEQSTVKLKENGKYSYFKLEKKDYSTMKAIQMIGQFLRIPERKIGFAGTKDRRAVTEQVISIKEVEEKHVQQFKRDAIKLTFLGKGNDPVSLGDLKGNYFGIVIRNLEENERPEKIEHYLNYFDKQRFSTHNVEIGKAFLDGDFKKCCVLVEDELVQKTLEKNPGNYLEALKKLPLKLLKLFVHAYQSKLWNDTVHAYLEEKEEKDFDGVDKKLEIPLIGFGMEDIEDKKLNKIIQDIMKQENITERSFIIRSFPELSCEGGMRKAFAQVHDLTIREMEEDEFNKGKKKCEVTFSLDKGCYATKAVEGMI
jgi:tRNA pseudouridine13 synthase